MNKKIVVIGSSNIDLIMKMERLPALGETVTEAEFMQVYGGKGANTAVGAARAGGDVAFVNCVGEDAYTPMMLENYLRDGIDCRYIFQEKGLPSGHALVMVGRGGNNYLSVAPGANYRLDAEKIERAKPLISQASIVLLQYEVPAETNYRAIDLANELGVPVLWNFAPARDCNRDYLGLVSVLVVNEVEAAFLSGIQVEDVDDASRAADLLHGTGAPTVIVTLGERGALLSSDDEKLTIPAFNVEAVDTTAAGDIFCGCLAVALVEGKSQAEAVRFASAASALSVTRLGAQPSAPPRSDIDAFLASRS